MIFNLLKRYKQWRCKPTMHKKHDAIVFSPALTVIEIRTGKKTGAYCYKCNKYMGQM